MSRTETDVLVASAKPAPSFVTEHNLGAALAALNQTEQALKHLRAALAVNPGLRKRLA
jgi:hypothetical protein